MAFGKKKIDEDKLKSWVDKELNKGSDMEKIKEALNKKYSKKDVDEFLEKNYVTPEELPTEEPEEEAEELPTIEEDEPEEDEPETEKPKKPVKKAEPKGSFSLDENEMALAVNALANSEEFKVYQQMVIGQQIAEIIATYDKAVKNKDKLPKGNETQSSE